MNNKENIDAIIRQLSSITQNTISEADNKQNKAIFEIISLQELDKMVQQLDEDKKSKLIEILKTIK